MNQRDIFAAAIQISDPAERAAYLERACGGDMSLRQRMEALLRAYDSAGDFLDRPAVEQWTDDLASLTEGTEDDHQFQAPGRGEKKAEALEDEELTFLQPSSKPGSLGLLGHYEVQEVLGRGGFAIVVRAFDEMLQRIVAIKVLSAELAATSPARKRFLREARATAAIRDDHVVRIYAVEEQPRPYLVMEYIPGQTLQQKLDASGPLETPEMLRLAVQIARGLAAAHAQGLIHRDIKPSNILLEEGSETKAKLTDFGLARTADDASLTQSGVVAGTPLYMAPEQARGETIDHRADLFSLGSVFYVMLSGRPPFRAPNALAVLKRVCDDRPRPVREIIPEVPQWLCKLISKLHAKKPAHRFQTAQEVANLLARPPVEATNHHQSPGPRPRRWKWFVAAGLLLAVALTLGLTGKRLTNLAAPLLGPRGGGSKGGAQVEDPSVPPDEPPDEPLPPGATAPKLKKSLEGHTRGVISVAYSPNGRLLASGDETGEVRVWNVPDGTPRYVLPPSAPTVHALAFSPDSKYLLTSPSQGEGDINIWDAETGKSDDVLKGHTNGLFEISFSPDGKTLVSGGWDGTIRIWDFEARREQRALTAPPVGQWIRSVIISADGKIAVGGPERVFLIGTNRLVIKAFDTGAGPLAFSPDGQLLAGTTWGEGGVVIWNVKTGEKVGAWKAHTGTADGVAFSGDGRVLATAGQDGFVRLWEVATSRKVAELPHEGYAYQLAFAPDGATLATTGKENRLIKLWDITFLRTLKAAEKDK